MARKSLVLLLFGVIALLTAGHASAEDLKSRWYFGGSLSFLSTTDDIRNNAAIQLGPLGDDGIPFTGDLNESTGCPSNNTPGGVAACDPRPDDLLGRETAIEETLKLDLTAGYGLTSWLSLQFDASYFKGDVGPIDVFVRDNFPISTNPLTPNNLNTAKVREFVVPVSAGTITEVPVSLSGIVRFRKDSPLNPYVGLGAGMIFTEMDRSSDVDTLNERLGQLRIRFLTNEFNKSLARASDTPLQADGKVPFRNPVLVEVDNAFEWHLMGGAEYFFNDRFSMVFDARYMFADQSINLLLGREDQINYVTYSERMFRSDGSMRIFNSNGTAPNPLCMDSPNPPIWTPGSPGGGCPNPNVTPWTQSTRVQCTAASIPGDFDGDGNQGGQGGPDICFNKAIYNSQPQLDPGRGDFVVQGGTIDLTGFAVAVGLRIHF